MNDNIPEIFNLPVETSIASGDLIPIFDVSAGQIRKITQANLTAGVGVTDHGGLSGLTDDDHTQYLLAAGTRALSANWDAGSFEIRAQTFQSDVATGTAPLIIASTTACTNLNADMVDGVHASAIYQSGGTDVAVADGGTGRSSHTAYAVICGGTTGTDAQQSIASVGNSGEVLTSNGAGALPTFQSSAITPGSTTITNTATVTFADPGSQYTMFYVECWGGGGSGGKGLATQCGAGGGGGGYSARLYRRAEITFPATVAIAAGGAAVSAADTDGNVGGNTTFTGTSVNVVAYGGGGGGGASNLGNGGGGGGSDLAAGGTPSNSPLGGASGYGEPATTSSANRHPGTGGSWISTSGIDAGNGFGGLGGGGSAASSTASNAGTAAGNAVFGGGGGGAGAEDSSPAPTAGGTSVYGGAGGAGAFDASNATAGTQPGGGGGGSEEGNSGKGGDGQIRITYW